MEEAAKTNKFSQNIMANSTFNCGGSGHCKNCGSGAWCYVKDKNVTLESIYRAN